MAQAVAMTTSSFTGLTLEHPVSWKQYAQSPGDNLQPGSEGYLTNLPIAAACAHASDGPTSSCGNPVDRLTPRGVYIAVDVLYQDPDDTPLEAPTQMVAGYPAQLLVGGDALSECPPGTATAISTTIAPPNLEPSQVWIFACLGVEAGYAARGQVMTMIATSTLHTRPPASQPVAGATRCATSQTRISPGPRAGGVSQTRALDYAVENVGTRACVLDGFPTVQLGVSGRRASLTYSDGGGPYSSTTFDKPDPTYLVPGGYASFLITQRLCQLRAATVTTVTVTLPGQTTAVELPAADQRGTVGLTACPGQRADVIYVGALTGY
jgi:hypothetical protein